MFELDHNCFHLFVNSCVNENRKPSIKFLALFSFLVCHSRFFPNVVQMKNVKGKMYTVYVNYC